PRRGAPRPWPRSATSSPPPAPATPAPISSCATRSNPTQPLHKRSPYVRSPGPRGRPVTGRIFSGQLIRDNLDIGRPDKVSIVFGRMIRQRGKFRTPGTFRTQVITTGTCPCLYLYLQENPRRAVPQGRT